MMARRKTTTIKPSSPKAYINRELSWLSFARRVLALAESPDLPLLERLKFAGIVGMLHDEFFMKRISGLKRQIEKGSTRHALDGRTPEEEFDACREELIGQCEALANVINQQLMPDLAREKVPIRDYDKLDLRQQNALRKYFEGSVMPILTPLAVDPEHPFPFVSNLGLNLAVGVPDSSKGQQRFVRIKIPSNLPRWVSVPDGVGFTPLEQVIAANLDLMYSSASPKNAYLFRVTRGAEGDRGASDDAQDASLDEPGSIIDQVSHELKARRFAGVVRLQVSASMPKKLTKWLSKQLSVSSQDVYTLDCLLGVSELTQIPVPERDDLRFAPHEPVVHPRLRRIAAGGTGAIFNETRHGDILLHHPYHCFDSSVLRFIESAAEDPNVLAIKLTIYRTSSDSPIVRALAEAARHGKEVAVVVEVTARFDEAPNIAWGQYLENEGVHVAYGVESLKTHVKLALVVRQEGQGVKRYAHVGTGNYHPGTAKMYEDVGVLTADEKVCHDVAAVFNALTGATSHGEYRRLLVAPASMRKRFIALVRRESEHAKAGKPCGIDAKMNQLQDPEVIRELYRAGAAGVPIRLNVRGLCCLRPGMPGLSENIRVFSVVGRFLEHSRIFRFVNAGEPEYFIGSADWMKRNLSSRVETAAPVLDDKLKRELDAILDVYAADNASAWDCGPDGVYVKRRPAEGTARYAAQDVFIQRARRVAVSSPRPDEGAPAPAGDED
jgi:polyphosphate kinase